MRDTATMAAQSDPACNAMFGRRWTGPPPRKPKGQRRDPLTPFGKLNLNIVTINSRAEGAAQRAVRHAVRRVAEIERRAEIMAAVGLADAALRLAAVAESIREVLS